MSDAEEVNDMIGRLDGSLEADVALLTGLSRERLWELGGFVDE